jgi:3-deoxy-7-phosphoheptulonate synthase
MRFYPEKPRSEKDWKGFTYDPLLDGSDDMNLGVVATRMLACRITDTGVPLAMERLNANTPQFLNGLVTYDAIGARNAADQKAREYLSGTSSVGGIKNPQDGNVAIAAQGVASAKQAHGFIGMDEGGSLAHVKTTGNETAHIILRGSDSGPNYYPEDISKTKALLSKKGLLESIIVDASHGNSHKKADRQMEVIISVAEQVSLGETAIRGVMIESNLKRGNQKLRDEVGNFKPKEALEKGVSVTDECVDLEMTKDMLEVLAKAVRARQQSLPQN